MITHILYVTINDIYISTYLNLYFTKDTTINEKHKISFELKMLRQIISHIINVEFQIASLLEDKITCSITCKKKNGRMAFIHEGKRIKSFDESKSWRD